jgi:hypothetical protein
LAISATPNSLKGTISISLEINDGSIFNLTWNKARVTFKEYGGLLLTDDRFYVVLEEQGIK